MNVKETRGEILDQLNRLLTISHDAEKGYKEAAENAKTTTLKVCFWNSHVSGVSLPLRWIGKSGHWVVSRTTAPALPLTCTVPG